MIKKAFWITAAILLTHFGFSRAAENDSPDVVGKLTISPNGRYFVQSNGKPFFYLGDTGWLLFAKLNREDAEQYLEDRRKKGFNVIQIMTLHTVTACNFYGDSALVGKNISKPLVTPGNNPNNPAEYDFWDHVDYVVDLAAKKNMYVGMVPIWGTPVKSGQANAAQAKIYTEFLAKRYKDRSNVIWLNGGDIAGSDSIKVWKTIGSTLRANDPNHLITYHPRGRTTSSRWFHNESWLDFNMFQSGHRRYDQDDSKTKRYGEDNWRYMVEDLAKKPAKPSFDGEPSYENIIQGLHDFKQPRWTADDIRRYAYWSVFAGGCGYTYGENSIMQFYRQGDKEPAYAAKEFWQNTLNAPGASQMIHVKELMLSRPYFERVPDQSIIAKQPGTKYNYQVATRGKDYAFVYTYNGKPMTLNLGKIEGAQVKASWFNPRTGKIWEIGTFANKGIKQFKTPGTPKNGNDWVLILDSVK